MAGNWKMYKTAAQTSDFFAQFAPAVAGSTHAEVVICAPFVDLPAAVEAARNTSIEVGAQDVFWLKEGAYTGEISAPMLAAVGCRWVIIGHSERRQYFSETDETVFKKTVAALEAGLTPIVCVGERLEEREAGATEAVLRAQFEGGISGLDARTVRAHRDRLRAGVGHRYGQDRDARDGAGDARVPAIENRVGFRRSAASACRILYGGSVKPDNVQGLMAQSDIDGALVGGASLAPASFAAIVNYL